MTKTNFIFYLFVHSLLLKYASKIILLHSFGDTAPFCLRILCSWWEVWCQSDSYYLSDVLFLNSGIFWNIFILVILKFFEESLGMGLLSFIALDTCETFYMKTCVSISENYPFIISFWVGQRSEKYLLYYFSSWYFYLYLFLRHLLDRRDKKIKI